MSSENAQELVQLDIARTNAKDNESIITTAYSWYHWIRAAKNLGTLALSATPSAAIKFGAQLTLQPLADKLSEITGDDRISWGMRIGIACADPVGSGLSYGVQLITDAALRRYEINNPHLKAIIKVVSQETSSNLVYVVKTSEIYNAASDCVSQKIEENAVGVKVIGWQNTIDEQFKEFDNHDMVKAAVKKSNEMVETISNRAASLPGAQQVIEVKQSLTKLKTDISKKLENPITNTIAEKAREFDNYGALVIRNSRLQELEIYRQSLTTDLKGLQEKKQISEDKLKKWQKSKLEAEQNNDEAALAKANSKIVKHEESLKRAARAEESILAQLNKTTKDIARNTRQVKNIKFQKLNNQLQNLLTKKRLLEIDLDKAKSDEDRKQIHEKLKKLEEEIQDVVMICESCIQEENGVKDEARALEVLTALKELREKNKVIVRVWLPKEEGELTSQLNATQGACLAKTPAERDAYTVGHVSIQMPDGDYISWWPGQDADSYSSVVPGKFYTLEQDIQGEDGPPDKIFTFYTLDTEEMNQVLSGFKSKAAVNDVGWTLFDNSMIHDNHTSGVSESKTTPADTAQECGTSCSGLVLKLLVAGGLDQLATIPSTIESFISRCVFSFPEGMSHWLESAEQVENATYLETQQIREQKNSSNYPPTFMKTDSTGIVESAEQVETVIYLEPQQIREQKNSPNYPSTFIKTDNTGLTFFSPKNFSSERLLEGLSTPVKSVGDVLVGAITTGLQNENSKTTVELSY